DARGLASTFASDGFGQVWTRTSPDAGTVRNAWDAAGRRTSAVRAYGTPSAVTTTYEYDGPGRLVRASAGGSAQSFAYDARGTVHSLGFAYDAGDQLVTLSNIANPVLGLGYNYDALGRLMGVQYGNGSLEAYGLDATGNRRSHSQGNELRTLQVASGSNRVDA